MIGKFIDQFLVRRTIGMRHIRRHASKKHLVVKSKEERGIKIILGLRRQPKVKSIHGLYHFQRMS